jgi:hypothetical protein
MVEREVHPYSLPYFTAVAGWSTSCTTDFTTFTKLTREDEESPSSWSMVLPVGLVSLADKYRDVHPLHVHLHEASPSP